MTGTNTEAAAVESSPSAASPTPVVVGGFSSGVPLGVSAFGFCILIFGIFNIGAVDAGAISVFAYVAMYTGGIGMGFGGIWEARSNNVFGATFNMAYAFFLITTGVLLQYVQPKVAADAGQEAFNQAFAAWLFLWTVFTVLYAVGGWYINLPAFLAFTLLAVVYFTAGVALLTTGEVATTFTRIAGWFAIADGLAAWYLAIGLSLNAISGKNLFPMKSLVSN